MLSFKSFLHFWVNSPLWDISFANNFFQFLTWLLILWICLAQDSLYFFIKSSFPILLSWLILSTLSNFTWRIPTSPDSWPQVLHLLPAPPFENLQTQAFCFLRCTPPSACLQLPPPSAVPPANSYHPAESAQCGFLGVGVELSSGEPRLHLSVRLPQWGAQLGWPPITSVSEASSGGSPARVTPIISLSPCAVRGSSLLKSMKASWISLLDHCLSLELGACLEHSNDYYSNHKRIYSTMCQKPSKASNVFNSSAVCNNCQLLILRYSLSAITELARGIVGVKPRILASKSVSFIILDCLSSSLHLCWMNEYVRGKEKETTRK